MADAEPQIRSVYDMLRLVRDQLFDLAHIDDVFWQVQAIICENPDIKTGGVFQSWLERRYVDSVSVGLRRLADKRRNVVSLWRVLEEMKRVAPLLTKARYLGLHDGPFRRLAEEWWEKLVGESEEHVTKRLIGGKQKELLTALDRVSRFADQNVAHFAAIPNHAPATFDDVRKSIVAAFKLCGWCSSVLASETISSPVPWIQSKWVRVFRVPWIPPGQDVPKYRRLDKLLQEAETDSQASS